MMDPLMHAFGQDNGHTEGRAQRYREAPDKLRAAIKRWQTRQIINFLICLGDIINGNTHQPVSSQSCD